MTKQEVIEVIKNCKHETVEEFKEVKTYTKDGCLQIMKNICDEYHLKLIFLTNKQGFGGFNYGASSINEIMLAPFKCKNPIERQFISFFHEFAHLKLTDEIPFNVPGYIVNNSSQMQYEIWITMIGIKFAKEKYNIIFSDDAVQWILKKNFSYSKSESCEKCSLIQSLKNSYSLDIFHIREKKKV